MNIRDKNDGKVLTGTHSQAHKTESMTSSSRPSSLFGSVSRVRSALLAANVLIGAAFIATAVHRVTRDDLASSVDVNRLLQLEPDSFRSRATGATKPPSGRLLGVASFLDPPPPPVVEQRQEEPEENPVDQDDQGVEIGGVLAEQWEYRGLLSGASGSDYRAAILYHKTGSNAALRRRIPVRRTRSSGRRTISRSRTRSRRSSRLSMSLEPYERKQLNPPDGPTIWVVKITPKRVVYEVQEEGWKRYCLPRTPPDPVYCTWREWREWKATNRDPEERPGYFILGRRPDARSLFEARREQDGG